MPRGIYKRKNGKIGKAKKVVQDYANPIQVLADEVVELKKKAMTAGAKQNRVATWNSNDPNYFGGAVQGAEQYQQYPDAAKNVETTKNEQLRMENEQMKEYLSNTRRVLSDRVNTIILLLENLKSSL